MLKKLTKKMTHLISNASRTKQTACRVCNMTITRLYYDLILSIEVITQANKPSLAQPGSNKAMSLIVAKPCLAWLHVSNSGLTKPPPKWKKNSVHG